jgi:putative peptidoglycan lipid II flippase
VTGDLAVPEAASPSEAGRPLAASLARAGIVVSAAYLASRLLGYLRVVVIGTTFGAGPDLDAFFAAFRVPDLIFQLVAAGAVASALVPIVSGLQAAGEAQRAWRIVSTVANLMLAGLVVLAVVGFVLAPSFVPLITPGFDGPQLARTIDLTRLMLAGPILLGLGAVATAALNGSRRFAASAIAPIVYNLAIIGAAVVLGPSLGVTGLAIGVVAGSLVHLAIQLPPLARAGFRYMPRIDIGDGLAREALLLMAPRAIGLGATQLIFLVLTSLASSLGPGQISSYTIAFALLQIPTGVIGIPIGIVLFPSLAAELAKGSSGGYLALIERGLRVGAYVMLPIAALGMVLRTHVVELLLGYGRFGDAAIDLTAATFALFLIGLPAHAALDVLARAFYARRDTLTPVLGVVAAAVVTIAIAVWLVGPLGLPAVGLALSLGTWLEALLLATVLRRREPAFDLAGIAWLLARSMVGAAAAALAALAVLAGWEAAAPGASGKIVVLGQAVLATVAGGAAYVLVTAALRVPELGALVRTMLEIRRGAARPAR